MGVHKRQGEALESARARGDSELAADTLSEASIDAGTLTVGAGRVGGEALELGIQSLGILTVLLGESSTAVDSTGRNQSNKREGENEGVEVHCECVS